MEWLLIYSYLTAVVVVVYLFFKWKFSYWKNRGVPTFEPRIPYGNLYLNDTRHLKDILGETYNAFKKTSPLAGIYFSFSPVAVATDLDLIRTVLIKNFNQFHDRSVYYNEKDDPLSAHMFSVAGEKWRGLRHKLSPTFSSGKMKYMFSTVVEICENFTDTLREDIKVSPEVEMKEYLARFTTDVIGRCAFGIDCNSLKDPNAEFRRYGKAVFTEPRHGQIVTLFLRQFPHIAKKMGFKIFPDKVTDFFLRVVRETVTLREEKNLKRNDFMDLLIELKNQGEGLSMEEIAAQAFIFFLAGFETSSTLLTYALYELGQHPDVQEKAREEVKQVLEKHNGVLSYEAMKEMRFLDQILSESLRKYPSLPVLVRNADRDFLVPDTEIVIEKGTKVFVPMYSIHYDPEIFPDPEKFDPHRFDPEEVQKRHPMSFLAFGDGPRNCVGLRFGRMQSCIGLINMLRSFRIMPNPKTKVPFVFNHELILLGTKEGMYLNLEELK